MQSGTAFYGLFLLFHVALISLSIAFDGLKGDFIRPSWFLFFRALFVVQQGILAGLILAAINHVSYRFRFKRIYAVPLLGVFYIWLGLYAIWGLIWSIFGISMTPDIVWNMLFAPDFLAAIGVSATIFYALV